MQKRLTLYRFLSPSSVEKLRKNPLCLKVGLPGARNSGFFLSFSTGEGENR